MPRPATFDPTRRDTVLDLSDLIENRIDAVGFFAENHITEGMKTLLTEGFRRLEGKSPQGVFKLTQAMGGGKTHNLLPLGLLARHSEHRNEVMGSFYRPSDIGPVRVVAFSGRESDAPLGVWGAIAEQLGRREHFKDYYAPLSAPGQTAWVNLLRGDPLVIMLDELPPYFVNAASKSIGNSDLSVVTATALANLLVAIGRDELHNVCLVLSDLTASYAAGSQQIVGALQDLERETGRTAMNLEPVQMNTDEFYQILRKRIFEVLPDESEIEDVAQGYAQAVRDAKQRDVTNASPEAFANRIVDSYPFHPAVRDLGESPFGRSLVRQALYAVWVAAETGDVAGSLTWLRAELDDYSSRKEALGAILRHLAAIDIDHWREDAAAARLVAGAVENDHV